MIERITIEPAERPIDAVVRLPGSKSITNRALVMAALAEGESAITCALFSDDTRYMAAALATLGIVVDADEAAESMRVQGLGGVFPARSVDLFVGNAGTAMRFLTAFVALGRGEFCLDGVTRMRQRPIADLLSALRQAGVDVRCRNNDDCPPVDVRADGLRGGNVMLDAGVSSQYLSALLMVAPYAREGMRIELVGKLVSEPYVRMTTGMMAQWGVSTDQPAPNVYCVAPGQRYRAMREYRVEPDASSASYFMAAAAVTGGRVRIPGIGTASLQGDVAFADVLEQAGCHVERGPDWVEVRGPERLRGLDIDMNAISDTAMTLAVVALFADGPTRIRNVAHVRQKESDRVSALAAELRKLGAGVEEQPDGLTIDPPAAIRPAAVKTYDDHRMAMSFAVAGLRAPGVTICDPACVAKTFPGYFRALRDCAQGTARA